MNCDLFSNSPDKLWVYLKNCITPEGFEKLYSKREIEPELLMHLITGLLKGWEANH